MRGSGCPICNLSNGEKFIRELLKDNDISFTPQESFNNLKGLGGGDLRYDFYLSQYNTCIEYDGIQHFKPISCWGGQSRLEETQYHDALKDRYCIDNGLGLIRLDYENNIKIISCPFYEDIDKLVKLIGSRLT